MRYTKPFSVAQKSQAIRAYRSMRLYLRELKQKYPPANRTEQEMLQKYREATKAFRLELKKPAQWIDAEELNQLQESAHSASLSYVICKLKGR